MAFNSFRKKHLLVHAGPGSACNYGGLLPSGSQLDQWWCVKNEMFICCKMLISDRMWLICQDRFKVFFQFVQFALHLISIFSIVTRFVFGYYFLKKKKESVFVYSIFLSTICFLALSAGVILAGSSWSHFSTLLAALYKEYQFQSWAQ